MSKIAYLSPVSFIGGAEESLCTFLRFLDRDRFEPLVVLPSHGPLERRLLKENVRLRIVSPGYASSLLSRKSLSSLFLLLLAIPEIFILSIRLGCLVRKEGIDIIHSNGLKCHFIASCIGCFNKKIKVVWHVREIYNNLINRFLKFFRNLGRAKVIAISEAVKKSLGFNGAAVIYNGVDLIKFRPYSPLKNLRDELGINRDSKIVTMLGAVTFWKGQHIFLEAIARIKERFPDLAALVAGGEIYKGIGHRGYMSYLKERVKELNVEGRVIFLGFRWDIPYIINSSDTIVHASIEPEPFGRVIIEAMACGKVVIAARGGAVEEIIRDRADGLIVERNNSLALADAISDILENKDLAREIARKAREKIEKFFSAEKMTKEIENLYLS